MHDDFWQYLDTFVNGWERGPKSTPGDAWIPDLTTIAGLGTAAEWTRRINRLR